MPTPPHPTATTLAPPTDGRFGFCRFSPYNTGSMVWIYISGAVLFPLFIIFWRVRTPLTVNERRRRVGGSMVIVWLLIILWSVRPAAGNVDQIESQELPNTADTELWQADSPPATSLVMLLGWMPGLLYAYLLMMFRRPMERPESQVIDLPDQPEVRRR